MGDTAAPILKFLAAYKLRMKRARKLSGIGALSLTTMTQILLLGFVLSIAHAANTRQGQPQEECSFSMNDAVNLFPCHGSSLRKLPDQTSRYTNEGPLFHRCGPFVIAKMSVPAKVH